LGPQGDTGKRRLGEMPVNRQPEKCGGGGIYYIRNLCVVDYVCIYIDPVTHCLMN